MKATRVLEFQKLQEACGNYQHLNYAKGSVIKSLTLVQSSFPKLLPPGAIELPLQCAQDVDPDNIGMEYWDAGSPSNDPRVDVLEKRLRCYDLVLDSLDVFETQSSQAVGGEAKLVESLYEVRDRAYELALASHDPIFHSCLYEWLIRKGMTDALLEVSALISLWYGGRLMYASDSANIPRRLSA